MVPEEGLEPPTHRITNALLYQLSYSGGRGAQYTDSAPRS